MAGDANLYESTDGNIFLAYLLLREEGKNIPPSWISRSKQSRKNREKDLAKLLHKGSLDAANYIRDWELAFKKECFYTGLRALLDLERHRKTNL